MGNPNAFVDLTTAWTIHYTTALASTGYADVTTTVQADLQTWRSNDVNDLNSACAAEFVTNG